jgi:signal peptide peptidase SppA
MHADALVEARSAPWAITPESFRDVLPMLAADGLTATAGPPAKPQRSQGVSIIPIRGIITPRSSLLQLLFGGTSLQSFTSMFRMAEADDQIGTIVLDVDSPGGMTSGVTETAQMIRGARKQTVAVANSLMASAAYWLGSACDEVCVTPSAFVGSIGVYLLHEDLSGFLAKVGVKTTIVSAGKYKAEGNEYEPLSSEAAAAMQSIVDDVYDQFVGDIAKGRGTRPAAVRDGYGQGRLLTASKALSEGVADRKMTLDQVVNGLIRGTYTPTSGAGYAAKVVRDVEAARLGLELQELAARHGR